MRYDKYLISEVKLKNASKAIVIKGLPTSKEDRRSVLKAVFPWKSNVKTPVGLSWEIQGTKADGGVVVVYDTKNATIDKAFAKKRKLDLK